MSWKVRPQQRCLVIADDVADRAIDRCQRPSRSDDGHADRGILERVPEQGLAFRARSFRGLPQHAFRAQAGNGGFQVVGAFLDPPLQRLLRVQQRFLGTVELPRAEIAIIENTAMAESTMTGMPNCVS